MKVHDRLWQLFLLACFTATAARAEGPPSALRPVDRAKIQAVIEDAAREMRVPGAMVLLRTPEGEFTFAYGTTALGSRVLPTAGTHFRIASNTKTMTAAVILLLAKEGRLGLDDPISKYVSGVPRGDEISVAQLLSMRSGLPNYTADPGFANSLDQQPGRAWTPAEVLAIAFSQKSRFAPGTSYDYCNTNYALLGLVAEKIEEKGLAQIFQERLFGPLALSDTLLPATDSTTLPQPYSHGYMYGGSSYALVDAPYPEQLQAEARLGKLLPHDYTNQNASYASAAGGAISTATDLADWIEALVDGKVLDAETQREWAQAVQPEDPGDPQGQKYGYGIAQLHFADNTMSFHGGELPGFNSFIGRDPDRDVTLVIWTNLTVSLEGKPPANGLMLKMLEQVYLDSPLSNV